jgi:hypothetical protein
VGAADDIGGKPALLVFFTMGFASSSFFENKLNGDGAVTDMGGKALLVADLFANGLVGEADDIGGKPALLELFTVGFASSSFFENTLNGDGAVADMGGKALLVADLVANGLVGAADDIGGKPALLVFFTMGFASSSFFENTLNGDGAVADMGGKALLVADLVANGLVGEADDIGGKPALLELFTVGFASSSFFENTLNGDGAVADMGGKALLVADLVANGLVGAADDIGGKPALLVFFTMGFASSSFFENTLNGDGAVADMGGKALLVADLVANGLVGAADDIGGKPALLELFTVGFLLELFSSASTCVDADTDIGRLAKSVIAIDLFSIVVSVVTAPNSVLDATLGTTPPNENPLEPMLLDPNPPVAVIVVVVDKAEPPKENPPAPILPLETDLLASASDELLS